MGHWARVLIGVVAWSASACVGGKPAARGCGANAECKSGEICNGGSCERLCISDRDCDSSQICGTGFCAAGSRSAAPEVHAVDSDGPADNQVGHADHHLGGRLIVQGAHLDGASLQLTSGSDTWDLTPCETGTSTSVAVALPSDLTSGSYQLAATNQAGSCAATLEILQGVPGDDGATGATGPNGSPDTATEILIKLTSVDGPGSGLDADTVDGKHAADLVASGADATLGAITAGAITATSLTLTDRPLLTMSWYAGASAVLRSSSLAGSAYTSTSPVCGAIVNGRPSCVVDGTSYTLGANPVVHITLDGIPENITIDSWGLHHAHSLSTAVTWTCTLNRDAQLGSLSLALTASTDWATMNESATGLGIVPNHSVEHSSYQIICAANQPVTAGTTIFHTAFIRYRED